MAIKYRLVQRKDLSKDAAPNAMKYYPQLVSSGRVELQKICEEVAEQSSLTSGDVKNCLDRLIHCITSHIEDGQTVAAGDLGTFSPVLRSEGCDTIDKFNAATMMRPPKIRYTPGKKLMEARGTVNYVRVKGATLEPADETQEPENPDVV